MTKQYPSVYFPLHGVELVRESTRPVAIVIAYLQLNMGSSVRPQGFS